MAQLFRKQAGIYAAARPTYPPALFSFLSSLTKKHERAWDVGTGNGQAAVALAGCYDQVIATDVSEQQLKHAEKRPNITYACTSTHLSREELARSVGEESSVDLVTVAQAVHWFDLPSFYSHVKHVLRKPGGVLAVWCYEAPTVNQKVDAVIADLYSTLQPYWEHPAIEMVEEGYESLHFPFEPVVEEGTGPFRMDCSKEATVEGLIGFLNSWSSVNLARERGVELFGEEVKEALKEAWEAPEQVRTLTFTVYLRIGTCSTAETCASIEVLTK